jgi:hypothetical protein
MQKRTPAVTGCGKTSDIAVLASFRQAKSRQAVNATLYDKLNFNLLIHRGDQWRDPERADQPQERQGSTRSRRRAMPN